MLDIAEDIAEEGSGVPVLVASKKPVPDTGCLAQPAPKLKGEETSASEDNDSRLVAEAARKPAAAFF